MIQLTGNIEEDVCPSATYNYQPETINLPIIFDDLLYQMLFFKFQKMPQL